MLCSNQQKWWPYIVISVLLVSTAVGEGIQPAVEKLSDTVVKCDTCQLPSPPPPPPPCPPPPPPPCPPPPPPPPKTPSCPCSETPVVNPPPPPALEYITSGPGNVYVTDPYGADTYSGQNRIRSSISGIAAVLGLWAILRFVV